MVRRISSQWPVLALFPFAALALGVGPAEAVIYCKTVGYPKGCVARPVVVAPAPVVVVPAPVVVAPRAVVAPRVGVGAPGVGVAPGYVGNRGGPVNRVGRF
jgi:hypothetical protein